MTYFLATSRSNPRSESPVETAQTWEWTRLPSAQTFHRQNKKREKGYDILHSSSMTWIDLISYGFEIPQAKWQAVATKAAPWPYLGEGGHASPILEDGIVCGEGGREPRWVLKKRQNSSTNFWMRWTDIERTLWFSGGDSQWIHNYETMGEHDSGFPGWGWCFAGEYSLLWKIWFYDY